MAKAGRPHKLDAIKKREVCALLAAGGTRTQAARYVGCSIVTIVNAARRNAKFRDEMRKAEASYEVMMLRNLSQAGSRSWRATAWALERRFPEMYGRRDLNVVTFDEMELVINELAQMMIEGISNPADRKRLIDHAAEISKFQRQKAEALSDPLLAARAKRRRVRPAKPGISLDPAPEVHEMRIIPAADSQAAAT